MVVVVGVGSVNIQQLHVNREAVSDQRENEREREQPFKHSATESNRVERLRTLHCVPHQYLASL